MLVESSHIIVFISLIVALLLAEIFQLANLLTHRTNEPKPSLCQYLWLATIFTYLIQYWWAIAHELGDQNTTIGFIFVLSPLILVQLALKNLSASHQNKQSAPLGSPRYSCAGEGSQPTVWFYIIVMLVIVQMFLVDSLVRFRDLFNPCWEWPLRVVVLTLAMTLVFQDRWRISAVPPSIVLAVALFHLIFVQGGIAPRCGAKFEENARRLLSQLKTNAQECRIVARIT